MSKQCNRCGAVKPLSEFSKAKTCKDGHRNYCKDCQSKKKKEWYNANKEHVHSKTKKYYAENPEIKLKCSRNWTLKNKEYQRLYKKKYRSENKDKINASTSARRKRVQQNTPPWAQRKEIVDFYLHCPAGYTVDHIIPLRAKNVSGLHVIDNLQYLTPVENYSKGNKCSI